MNNENVSPKNMNMERSPLVQWFITLFLRNWGPFRVTTSSPMKQPRRLPRASVTNINPRCHCSHCFVDALRKANKNPTKSNQATIQRNKPTQTTQRKTNQTNQSTATPIQNVSLSTRPTMRLFNSKPPQVRT